MQRLGGYAKSIYQTRETTLPDKTKYIELSDSEQDIVCGCYEALKHRTTEEALLKKADGRVDLIQMALDAWNFYGDRERAIAATIRRSGMFQMESAKFAIMEAQGENVDPPDLTGYTIDPSTWNHVYGSRF